MAKANKRTASSFSPEGIKLISLAFDFYQSYNKLRDNGESGKGPKCSPLASDAQSLMAKAFKTIKDSRTKSAIRAFNKGAEGLGNKGLKLLAKLAANSNGDTLQAFTRSIEERIQTALETLES